MAKIDLISKDWCELIFKDRNKAYGAYDMRLDTPKRHNIATLIVVAGVILVITLPMLIKFIAPERENKIVVNEVTTPGQTARGRNQTQRRVAPHDEADDTSAPLEKYHQIYRSSHQERRRGR